MHDFENNNIVHAASVWILYEDVLTAKKIDLLQSLMKYSCW